MAGYLAKIAKNNGLAAVLGVAFVAIALPGSAQETAPSQSGDSVATAPAEQLPGNFSPDPDSDPSYPLAVAVTPNASGDGMNIFAVDLDLPGVWLVDSKRSLFAAGTRLLRKPMNRPRCIAIDPRGGVFVGDSATREVYRIPESGAAPEPLTDGYIGVAMAVCVSPDGKSLYVGDAEKRATFRLPIEGGKCELVARVNARGLAFDEQGILWAVTPDAAAVVSIDVESGEVTEVVTGRPYQYPNGLTWNGKEGFVTDGYGKAIWKFTADGKTEKWHEGDPLVGPVGITATDDSIYVADPKQKQVYQFDRKSKRATPKL